MPRITLTRFKERKDKCLIVVYNFNNQTIPISVSLPAGQKKNLEQYGWIYKKLKRY